jgi:hypothetical protein
MAAVSDCLSVARIEGGGLSCQRVLSTGLAEKPGRVALDMSGAAVKLCL